MSYTIEEMERWSNDPRTKALVQSRQKERERIATLEARASCNRLDRQHPVTRVLYLLSNGDISVGKACEYIADYVVRDVQGPLIDESVDDLPDNVSLRELKARAEKTERDLVEEQARLDWLEQKHHEFDIWSGRDDGASRLSVEDQHGGPDGGIVWQGVNLRAAIDAARAGRAG